MANIRLAIGGLDDYPDYVASLMPPIQRAFSQLGVNLQLIRGPRLSSDPANTNSWPALMQQLDQAARNAGGNFPAHLFITDTAPSHDPTINGQLLHRLRGASAVFFGAGIYEPLGPRHNPALVSQVCMHEIGHLLNLTHDDGEPEPDGPPYSSAMMQADEREQQPVPMAWQAAAADAQARGEPALDIPNPLGIYPFSTRYRACLRAAAGNAGRGTEIVT